MFLNQIRLLEILAVIVVGYKADFHALLFVCRFQVAMASDFARVALRFFAERKHCARELVLAQRKEKITLVFAQIASALEQRRAAVFAFFEPGKVPRRDILRSELIGTS